MKRILILIAAMLLPLAAGAQTFSANLSGANEVGGGAPQGAGVAVVTFDGTAVTYTILVSGTDAPTAAHIHTGAAGVNGDIVLNFQPSFVNGTAAGTVNAEAAVVSQILANPAGFYVNVHTAAFPQGAVRGQLASASIPVGDTESFLPIAGKTPGQNNTFFVTDVRMVNRGSEPAEVKVEFFPLGAGGVQGPSATATVSVAPGQQVVANDAAATLLGANGLGAMRITSDSAVATIARIINDQRPNGNGTAGFAFEARTIDEAGTGGLLPFLSNATDFRTNIGYFNPLATPVRLTLTAHASGSGAILGSNTIVVPGYGSTLQGIFGVITSVPEASRSQEDFYVVWSSDAPVLVYASVTDNRTGDGVFLQ